MFKTAFLILLLAHILGDFYFQSNKLAKQKSKSFQSALKHCIIYAVTCFLIAIPVYDTSIVIGFAFLAISHFLIDFSKYFYINKASKENNFKPENERTVYIIDQLFHLITIAIIAYSLAANNYIITVLPGVSSFFEIIGIPIEKAFSWLLVLLLIWKPTNITIKILINLHKPQEKFEANDEEIKAGGFIGLLERLIILVLLSINQYSAIGLVLTAKSIARYDKISKDQTFAEYYLLGTLLSAIFVIITYLIIF
jgi:hypothetical protein